MDGNKKVKGYNLKDILSEYVAKWLWISTVILKATMYGTPNSILWHHLVVVSRITLWQEVM